MFFQDWSGIARTLIVGLGAYVGLVLVLRASGKRTLTKLNAFDLVVTVALGSTLATVLLNKNVALVEGLVAFALLTFAQYAVTWLSVRSHLVRQVVKSEPALLLYRGECLWDAMRRERMTKDELEAAARSSSQHSLAAIEAIVLETDGSLSVIPKSADGEPDEVLGRFMSTGSGERG
jgi:uncharacterized membrane protein YcaP (DUF421 family)